MVLTLHDLIDAKYTPPLSTVMIDAYGTPVTLGRTDNNHWFAYFKGGDFSIMVRKSDDMIFRAWYGRGAWQR